MKLCFAILAGENIQIMKPSLRDIKKETEALALNDLGEALEYLRQQLPEDSPTLDTVLSMIRRLNRTYIHKRKGLISLEDLEIIENQIFDNLLGFLRSLDKQKVASGAGSAHGKILYDIPDVMAVGREVRCRIRLAFVEEVIKENITLTGNVEIHSIQIGEVMSVELVDPAADPVFSIRSISDEVQRIDPDFYSEWWFYVQAMQEGQHTLVLRVSIIEQVDGVDRKRNIVLEEVIDIVHDVPAEKEKEETFKTAPYAIVSPGAEGKAEKPPEVGVVELDEIFDTLVSKKVDIPRTEPVVPPAPQPAAPVEEERMAPSGRITRWITYTAAAFILVISASYAMMPAFRNEVQWWMTKDTPASYVQYLLEHPNSHRADEAFNRIRSIEEQEWQVQEAPIVEEKQDSLPEGPIQNEDNRNAGINDVQASKKIQIGGELSDRKVLSHPEFRNDSNVMGAIVIDICVNTRGEVAVARVNRALTNLADPENIEYVLRLAQDWRFAPSNNESACGFIRFRFELR